MHTIFKRNVTQCVFFILNEICLEKCNHYANAFDVDEIAKINYVDGCKKKKKIVI